jgi:hypothetical protein
VVMFSDHIRDPNDITLALFKLGKFFSDLMIIYPTARVPDGPSYLQSSQYSRIARVRPLHLIDMIYSHHEYSAF